jgi:hypothetical protein
MDKEQGKLSNRLDEYGQEPSEKVWAGLESHLASRPRKRRFPFWWWPLAAGLFLSLGGGFWWLNQKKSLPLDAGNQSITVKNGDKINESPKEDREVGAVGRQKMENQKNQNQESLAKNNKAQIDDLHKILEEDGLSGKMENKSAEIQDLKNSGNQSSLEKVQEKGSQKIALLASPLALQGGNQEMAQNEEAAEQGKTSSFQLRKSKRRKSKIISGRVLVIPAESSNIISTELKKTKEESIPSSGISPSHENQVHTTETTTTKKVKKEEEFSQQEIQKPTQIFDSSQAKPAFVQAETASQNQSQTDSIFAQNGKAKEELTSLETHLPRPDSAEKQEKTKWRNGILVSARVPFSGILLVNQDPEGQRVVFPQNGSIWKRTTLELAIRLERSLLSWLAGHLHLGLVYQNDWIDFELPGNTKAEKVILNNQLVYRPVPQNVKGNFKAERFGQQTGLGFTLLPGGKLPEIHFSAGAYFSLVERRRMTENSVTKTHTDGSKFLSAYLSISASKSLILNKREFWIEPQFLWFPNTLFQYWEGVNRQVNYMGLGLGYRW